MRKHNFLKSTLCLLLALVCNVAWAEKMQPSTTLPDKGKPEHVYTMKNGNNVYVSGLTAPTQTEANYGQFAFYAVDDVEGAYYIYSHTAEKWFTYTKAESYSNGKDFVKMADAKEADDYFHVENYADDFYQIRPYNTTGVAGKYINWFQGVDGNPLDGTNTLGLWEDNATKDNGSKYSFTEVIVVVRTYIIDILGGADDQTIKIGDKTYKDGDTYTIEGSVSKGDITVVAPAGQFATVAIDDVNETITVSFANAVSQPATVAYEIPVLYPAQQTAVGEAKATKDGDAYTLSNKVLAASFIKMGGALYFAGSEAMNLVAGTEPFTVAFGNGDNVPASAMTLESVAFEELTGKADAVGGAEHYDGHALVANYTYTYKESTINIVWRAVLRDGSHYLRTEMELKGVNDVDMFNIIPMIYNVDTKAAGSTPEVIGNTRGAVLMSNKIFAGLETPTAYNTVGGATGEEDKWNLTTTIDPVTVEANAWVQMTEDEANQVKRVEEATGASHPYLHAFKKEGVELVAGQKVEVTLTYKQGANKLYIGGIDLLAPNGDIAAMDYHEGYTGSSHDKNTYTFIAPNTGTYAIRAIVHNKSEAINAKSELTANIYTPKEGVVINTDIVGIQGRWSRNTTLAAGETWKVAAVVGLIAQDGTQANDDIHSTQKRRSFLAYSERERAVPWRANPCYISWYELNINRNNAAPGNEPSNMTADQVLDVLAHWKSDFYDRYGMAPNMFVIDDGWDTYGEWQFHSGFPNEMRDIAAAAKEMNGAGIGAWLGPVGGYGQSGNYRRDYWSDKGGMQLSNPRYYKAFKDAAYNLVCNQDGTEGYQKGSDNYTFFKFDGISAQFSAVGPDGGDTGNENAEGIIRLERFVREELREDIFFNTTVGTWASPFWYQITDATWRQENDHGRIGNNSLNRENWITYRDRLVYQNYVKNSPICPINTLMTHGFMLTKFGPPAGDERDYEAIRRELRCAFLCGSGMVELYNDYDLMNSINGGALWADLAECIAWQKRNADVLPDAHWVGGNPWTGSAAEVYGWAAWNGTKSSLALRNGANDAQTFTFTLRSALNIPANVEGSIILRSAFGDQAALEGLAEGKAYGIDETITVTLPGSSVYGFEGINSGSQKNVSAITLTAENAATEVEMGKTLVLKAAVNADATFPALTWASSDEEVATVVGGLVLPKKVGTVTITATAKDGSNKVASYTLTVAPKAVDMDAPIVTDLVQLSNEKVYTLSSTRAFLFYSPDFTKIVSSNGKTVGSVTLDKTNPNHQFRIEKKGDNYYLYSVGAEKYVAKDGSFVATATDALTLTDVSANRPNYPWQLALGGNGMNSQDSGQTNEGIVFNSYNTTDDGNCYKIEVAVPKSYTYTIQVLGAEGTTVTYDGEEYENGGSFDTEATLSKNDFTPSVVDGKFAVVNIDGNTIYVSYFANDTKFYTIRGGHNGYVSLGEGYTDGGNFLLTKTDAPKDNKGIWAFVGNNNDGYKIYNYSTGLSKVLGMTGTEADARATMVDPSSTEHNTVFTGVFNFGSSEVSVINIKGTGHYWNKRGNYLALWQTSVGTAQGDQGCKFFLDEADYVSIPDEYIHEISEIAGISNFTPKNPNTLWYRTSAEATGVSYPWMEYALPLGNGELGCMVFGGVAHEELQFNEKTLWSGPANTVGAGGGNRTFMNFGSLIIANNDKSIYTDGVTDYVRYLDIEEGIAGVSFKNANGTKQTRKYLSSAPDQVIAGQYKSEGDDKLNLTFSLEPGNSIGASAVIYEGNTASFSGKMTVEYAARLHVVANEGAKVTATKSGIKVENATEVTFYLKGATNFDGDMKNTTSYFTTEDAAAVNTRIEADIEKAEAKGFDAIEEDHVADFTAITKRMTLNLGLTTPTVDTKTLIDNYYPNNGDANSTQNDHLFLEQLYFHYGRYLAISSNRKDIAAPNNLQGIWNDRGTDSPWNSDIHTNINIQMNYWPTEITNLSDLHKPFVNFIIRGAQSEGWKEVGNRYNDGHGWSVLTETSLYNSMSTWGDNYLVANVWYTSHLWMHYRYTQDKEFLKEAFPAMWGAAEFWFHRLIEDRGFDNTQDEQEHVRNYHTPYKYEPDGTFVAPNEFSAEQHDNQTEDGTAHAQQMIYYLFTNIKEAIDILGGKEAVGLSDADIAKLDEYLAKTDQGLHTEVYTGAWGNTYNGVNKGDSLLREWKYTPFDISNDKGHRHMSHMMALFPMDQITPESRFFEPAVNSLKLRGDEATGWSMGWKVNLWARAQDGDHAHLIIKNALKHSTDYGTNAGAGGIYYNLFDSHAPFQIDGNFGVCSGIAEMLLQSAHGYINVLPALPAVWERTGAVTGMKAMGNFTVDFNWQNGKAQQVTIVSNAGAELKVRCNRGAMDIANAMITVDGEEVTVEVDENGIATIPCAKGDEVVIDFTQERSPEEPAEFRQYWTASPVAPWNATALAAGEYPEAVSVNGLAVHKAETAVVAPVAGNVTATFVFSGGSHKLNILGVDLVNAEGTVVASDYHHGTTGGSHSNNEYTLNNVPAGEYTLRYFVGQGQGGGDALNQTNGAITVVGLNIPGAAPSNLPKAGKYYRIGYDFGGNVGVLYMQSTASGVSNKANALLMSSEKGEGSIFLVEDVNGNLRLKSISTGKYLKENGSTRGLQTEGGNVTFTEVDGKIKIQADAYLHANSSGSVYFVDHCGSDGHDAHNFIVEEVKVRTLTVEGPANAGATATWNGVTKPLPATWTMFGGTAVTESTLTVEGGVNYTLTGLYEKGIKVSTPVEISTLTSNRTFTAEFAPAFFSTENNLVPVRIRSARNNAYTIRLNASDSYTGKAVNSGVTVYGENELWYLVGTPESFKIYNRVAGMDLHVVLSGTSQASAASMNTTTDNSDFCLVAKDNGYAICPKNAEGQSFNMYGGAGADIKLFGSGDGGSIWLIEKMDASKSLTFSVNIEGEPWEGNRGAGAITITVDGIAGKANVESFIGEQKCYLPLNGTFTIASDTYRGYTFNGFNVNGSTIETLVDQTLSEDLNVVASYTANEEKVLYYTPSPTGKPYRIPAIATAPNGHIFAIADHRPCGNDIGYGEVDIKCRISTDNGATWSDEFFIADGQGGDSNNMTTGYGDAAVVADRESNKLLVMMVAGRTVCHNGRWDTSKIGVADADAVNRVARIYLTYNETTGEWEKSEIVEMTDHIYSLFLNGETPTVTSMFIGSGKICQSRVVKKGDYYRLYCSMWTRDGGNRVIYSDDFGGSWNVLGTINDRPASGGDEPKVEELRDGTVVLSSRVGGGRIFNLFTFADNTYTTGSWGKAVQSNGITNGLSFGGNSTNGEIYKVKAIHKESGRICDLMLQSIPTGGGRSDVAIYYKELDAAKYTTTTIAQNWTEGKHVSYKGSAYSTMISQADGRIAFLFEEEPGGYCIVYIPYTIEDVTGGAYSLYQVNSTIGQYEIGTFYASEAVVIPEGVKAYVATEEPKMEGTDAQGNATGVLTMTELQGIIPAHTGAVLRGAADTYKFIPSISYGNAVKGNMLVGFEADNIDPNSSAPVTVAEDYTTYVLAVKNEKAGFYRKEKGTFNVFNNKAYLDLSTSAEGVSTLAIRFDGDGTTDIEASTLNPQPSTEVYDLQGRRVLNPTKGVYIVNGKKVVIK